MNPSPSIALHSLDPAVEDAFYKPGETPEPSPSLPIDAMADDLAAEWDDGEIRPIWLESL